MNRRKRVVLAGGAGFIGSHLCDYFLARGDEVAAVDNFLTGAPGNVARLKKNPRFRLRKRDICFLARPWLRDQHPASRDRAEQEASALGMTGWRVGGVKLDRFVNSVASKFGWALAARFRADFLAFHWVTVYNPRYSDRRSRRVR